MLLREYAITPDVFDETCYAHPATCDAELRQLKELLLTEGLVRDLRGGEWSGLLAGEVRPWHRRGKELLKKLRQQNRLVRFEPHLSNRPENDIEWCREALETHDALALSGGIIATEPVKAAFPDESLVARIDRLSSLPWWESRGPSVRLQRDIDEYLVQLAPVLRRSNSLMFIDPHLDPTQHSYHGFVRLLAAAGSRDLTPKIEIHRVCYEGSGPSRTFPMNGDPSYFENRFRTSLEEIVREACLDVEVFIWDDFHDRYLVSDLLGISLPHGFDTTTNPDSRTTWTRLSRRDRDDVQREFDPPSNRHALQQRFAIP